MMFVPLQSEKLAEQADMSTESYVQDLFSGLGFEVVRIAEDPDNERADYRMRDSRDSYVLEVKDKSDADSILVDYHRALDKDDVFLRSESSGYRNAFSNVLDKAESQLTATAESHNEFRIAWLQLVGLDRKLQFQQSIATIYGTVQLIPMVAEPVAKACYYFKESVVFRKPNIDAFIISDGDSLSLATNPYSPRFHAVASTKLYNLFAEKKGVIDPVALERNEDIYVADCSISRKDSQAVLEYLQLKYGVNRFLDIEPVCTTASAKLPNQRG